MYTVASRYFLYTLGLLGLRKALVKEKDTVDVPSFRGIVEVKHKLRGRIRFTIPSLKGNNGGFQGLKAQLDKIDHIYNVQVNPITASLLVEHGEEIEATLIVGIIIKLLGLEEYVKNPPKALVTSEFNNAKESLSLAVNEKTKGVLDLKSILFLLFISMGVRKIRENPKLGPNGYTFLWWGFSMLK